jgi:predicted enzyme related to lactoylglutathione lyase
LAFYQNVFGMKIIREGKDLVFISDGQGGRIELLMSGEPALPAPSHLAFVVSLGEFDAMVDTLKRHVTQVDPPVTTPAGDRLCFFNDPAGNRAQIVGRQNPMPQ